MMDTSRLHPAEQLALYMQRIYDKGLTTTSGGNLSVRGPDGSIWITPGSVDKGALTRRDILRVLPDGRVEGPHKPSLELPFHTAIYQARPDLHAVLHAHPPGLVAFSMLRRTPELDLLPLARRICGGVQAAAYALPGSEELGRNICAVFAGGCDAAILENHGVCVGAADLPAAFQRFELLNELAEIELLARRAGTVRTAPPPADPPALPELPPEAPAAGEAAARRDMIALLRRACRTGLFTSVGGTCSLRLPDGGFLITPDGMDRAHLEEADLVLVRDGRRAAGRTPDRAAAFHEALYRADPGVRAVIQALPRHAMAFAISDAVLDPRVMPESYVFLRDLPVLSAPLSAGAFGPACPAALAAHDCAVVTGGSLLQAFDRLEVLEATARAVLSARALGRVVSISPPEVEQLKAAYHLCD